VGSFHQDIKAFEELFFLYHGKLVVFANTFIGDLQTAKDIVQDVFLSYWEKAGRVRTSPKAYLYQSVRNACLNHFRHQKIDLRVKESISHKISVQERSQYQYFDDPYHSLLELEIEDKIREVIQSLPEKCRLVFMLSRNAHMKNKEIADFLGISVKAVEKHLSRALCVLRHELLNLLGPLR
jgi:RNA polymerase sigma-70 factor (ECF subfamily)